jgi:glutathione synthase/RimK-type ligase-like ATP-grasp enzyme
VREPSKQRLCVLCARRELAESSAEALRLFVYGGDVIVKDGSMVVIDVNDWPSLAVVRDVAGEKIARARQAADEACRRLSPS